MMVEIQAGYFLLGVLLFSIFRLAETTKMFGARDGLPRKDGWLVFEYILGGVYLLCSINMIGYIVILPPELRLLAVYKIIPLVLFSIATILFGSIAFIAPSKNFLISLIIGTISTIVAALVIMGGFGGIIQGGDYAFLMNGLICVVIGVVSGVLCYIILWKMRKDLSPLWKAKQFWNKLNNRIFLLIFIIITGIEAVLQLQYESLLTIFM
ncbi:MAG: hypothetical protein ACTSYB_06440 [Candidatus Helarchaeota archaeon]